MRRFLTLVFMLCLAIPAGISISGCTRNPAGNYCYGLAYGLKNTDVASITLQPQTTGISLAFGQTQQAQQPHGVYLHWTQSLGECKPVHLRHHEQQAGGHFANRRHLRRHLEPEHGRRHSPTTRTAIFPILFRRPAACRIASAYITASADSVTSNPVKVFVHAQVSSVALVGPQQCLSQTQTANLDAQACFSSNGQQYLLCAPSSVTTASSPNLACPVAPGQTLASIPSCIVERSAISTSLWAPPASATINSTSNQITANAPGTTAINASIAGSGSSAGYFSTCPPQSISLSWPTAPPRGPSPRECSRTSPPRSFDTNNAAPSPAVPHA